MAPESSGRGEVRRRLLGTNPPRQEWETRKQSGERYIPGNCGASGEREDKRQAHARWRRAGE